MRAISLRSMWMRANQSVMLAGVLGTGVRLSANLVLLPIVLVKLSRPDLALWWAFLALGGFASLADFGFGPAISRVYSYLWAGAEDFETEGLPPAQDHRSPNFQRLQQFNVAVRYLYLRLSLIGFFLLALAGTAFLFKNIGENAYPARAWLSWAAFVAVIGYGLLTSHWVLGCQGVDRMRDVQLAYLFGSLCYVAVSGVLLLFGAGLGALITGFLARACIMHLYCRFVYYRAVPRAAVKISPNLHMVKRLWPNACKFGISSVGAYCTCNAHVLISTKLLGPDVTASVGLTVQVGGFLLNFASLWLNLKWPQITILRMQGRLIDMAVLFARRLGLVMVSYGALALFVVLVGNRLLEWKGTHTRLLPTPFFIFYLFYLGQQLFYSQFGALAHTENVVPFFRISVVTGIAVLVCGVVMTRLFGLWGLLLGPCLTELAYSAWFTVRRGFQGQPLSMERFCRAAMYQEV